MLLLAPPFMRQFSPSAASHFSAILRLVTTAAFATTVYLLYALTFVIYDLCLLCMASHVINITLMYRLVWRGESLIFPQSPTIAKVD
jgi:uncharacterized membrane protein